MSVVKPKPKPKLQSKYQLNAERKPPLLWFYIVPSYVNIFQILFKRFKKLFVLTLSSNWLMIM